MLCPGLTPPLAQHSPAQPQEAAAACPNRCAEAGQTCWRYQKHTGHQPMLGSSAPAPLRRYTWVSKVPLGQAVVDSMCGSFPPSFTRTPPSSGIIIWRQRLVSEAAVHSHQKLPHQTRDNFQLSETMATKASTWHRHTTKSSGTFTHLKHIHF